MMRWRRPSHLNPDLTLCPLMSLAPNVLLETITQAFMERRLEDSIQILVGQRIVRADEDEEDEDESEDDETPRVRSDELLVRTACLRFWS